MCLMRLKIKELAGLVSSGDFRKDSVAYLFQLLEVALMLWSVAASGLASLSPGFCRPHLLFLTRLPPYEDLCSLYYIGPLIA